MESKEKFPRGEKTFQCRDGVEGVATKNFRAAKKLFDIEMESKEKFPRDEKTFQCLDRVEGAAMKGFLCVRKNFSRVEGAAMKKSSAAEKLFNVEMESKERRRKISAR
jgi:hypothetical protein